MSWKQEQQLPPLGKLYAANWEEVIYSSRLLAHDLRSMSQRAMDSWNDITVIPFLSDHDCYLGDREGFRLFYVYDGCDHMDFSFLCTDKNLQDGYWILSWTYDSTKHKPVCPEETASAFFRTDSTSDVSEVKDARKKKLRIRAETPAKYRHIQIAFSSSSCSSTAFRDEIDARVRASVADTSHRIYTPLMAALMEKGCRAPLDSRRIQIDIELPLPRPFAYESNMFARFLEDELGNLMRADFFDVCNVSQRVENYDDFFRRFHIWDMVTFSILSCLVLPAPICIPLVFKAWRDSRMAQARAKLTIFTVVVEPTPKDKLSILTL